MRTSTHKMNSNKTFVRITNQDIYKEILIIKEHVIKTNGKVKLNRWIATTALTISLLIIGLKAGGII